MQVALFPIFLREKVSKKFSWKVDHRIAIERIVLTTAKETTHLSVTRLHHARYILMKREKERKMQPVVITQGQHHQYPCRPLV